MFQISTYETVQSQHVTICTHLGTEPGKVMLEVLEGVEDRRFGWGWTPLQNVKMEYLTCNFARPFIRLVLRVALAYVFNLDTYPPTRNLHCTLSTGRRHCKILGPLSVSVYLPSNQHDKQGWRSLFCQRVLSIFDVYII